MGKKRITPSKANRFVLIVGIVLLLAIVVYGIISSGLPVDWKEEFFGFRSGARCYVFREPKLVIFLGDDENEVFDHINSKVRSNLTVNNFLGISGSGMKSNEAVVSAFQGYNGKTTMRFLDGKCVMVVSSRGTKLTLADGQEFTLDGQTPLWLRCKPDGTIVELDELPLGFIEYFESPDNAAAANAIQSYPEAFQK